MAWQWLQHVQQLGVDITASWASCLLPSFHIVAHNMGLDSEEFYYVLDTSKYGAWGHRSKASSPASSRGLLNVIVRQASLNLEKSSLP